MTAVNEIIAELKRKWTQPRPALHRGESSSLCLQCGFDVPAPPSEIEELNLEIPDPLRAFWMEAQSAELFKDADFGQWGLRVLAPEEAVRATNEYQRTRHRDAFPGDLVAGEFLGDLDLLVLRCDKSADDFGTVFVALPLDPRSEWEQVGMNFADFLEHYVKVEGDKFWEGD